MKMKCIKMFILLTLYLSLTRSIKVFEFLNGEEEDLSTVSLEVSGSSSNTLTICSSHRQLQSNEQTRIFMAIFEDAEHQEPWLTVGYWEEDPVEMWLEYKKGTWVFMGFSPRVTLMSWIHTCLEINFEEKSFHVSTNGFPEVMSDPVEGLKPLSTYYIR